MKQIHVKTHIRVGYGGYLCCDKQGRRCRVFGEAAAQDQMKKGWTCEAVPEVT